MLGALEDEDVGVDEEDDDKGELGDEYDAEDGDSRTLMDEPSGWGREDIFIGDSADGYSSTDEEAKDLSLCSDCFFKFLAVRTTFFFGPFHCGLTIP